MLYCLYDNSRSERYIQMGFCENINSECVCAVKIHDFLRIYSWSFDIVMLPMFTCFLIYYGDSC